MKLKLAILLLITILVNSATGQELQETENALDNANSMIKDMNESQIPIQRVSDIFNQANKSFETQLERNRSGKEVDLTVTKNKVKQIENIHDNAFRSKDQLIILRDRIEELDDKNNLNLTAAKNQLEEAKTEFEDERFEKSQENIDQVYKEISEAQSAVTQAQAFASATENRFRSFIRNNWRRSIIATVATCLLSIGLFKEYKIYSLKRKKERLKQRREVLQELISDSQKKYFQENDLSESKYETRTDTYGEMIRDINRQVPLINEKLEERNSPCQILMKKFLGMKAESVKPS